MQSLSPYTPKLPISEIASITSNGTTPKDRVTQFYNLLNSSETGRFRIIAPYQKQWIAQQILYEGTGSARIFVAVGKNCDHDEGNNYGFTFEVRENEIEMQIFEKKNPHIQSDNGDEEYFIGSVPNLTFNDFDAVYPSGTTVF